MRNEVTALSTALTAAALLIAPMTRAAMGDYILVAKDTTTDQVAVYRRAANNVCSKQVLSITNYYTVNGTSRDDVIVVLSESDPVSFCGYANVLPFYLLDGGEVVVTGEAGMDEIWVGSTPALTNITVYGGSRWGADTSNNYVYVAGPRGRANAGSAGDYIVALNGATALGAAGDDVFMTGVSFLLAGPAGRVDGGLGYNRRFGPAVWDESNIQRTSTETYNGDAVYAWLESVRQAMLQ
jgi:hypothetical protein